VSSNLRGELAPRVDGFGDLIPHHVPEQWRQWLTDRAEDADTRRRELGTTIAQDVPQWAGEALGPVPEDSIARAEWKHKAGWVAAYRKLAGWADDADPLGAAPPAGLTEKFALWRTAHATLDLPDTGAGEAELTDGQLRIRVRAIERDETWAPATSPRNSPRRT